MSTRKGGVLLVLLVLALLCFPLSYSVTGFTNDPQLFFTGTSSTPSTLYQDAIGSNLDVGIELCGQGSSKYVGGFYALDITGSGFISSLITYGSSNNALAAANTLISGSCFTQSGAGFLTVSPSALATPDPDVDKAAFPGKLWIGYASSANPGAGGMDDYEFGDTNAQLLGSYSASRSYDQDTGLVAVSTPTISFQTNSGSFSKSATDGDYGITSDRKMVIGVCSDTDGATCSDGTVLTSASFPLDLDTGIISPNDQSTSDRNIVINGLNYAFCIGANLETGINSLTPNPIYYSQNLTVVTNIVNDLDSPFELNGGNVDVTTDFDITFSIINSTADVVFTETRTISSTLVPDGSTQEEFIWPAYARSGSYTAQIVVDSASDITECNEGDNTASSGFTLKAITLPDIYIDGNLSREFPYPNTPYNVTFEMKNSDNDTLVNASVMVIETNGLNLLGPTQVYNQTISSNPVQGGILSNNTITFRTNDSGITNIILIPTYNSLYESAYAFVNLSDYIGSYELYLSGEESDGETFIFIEDGSITAKYAFTIANTSYNGPYAQKAIGNNMVNQVMDFIYDTFVVFVKTIVG